PGLGGCVQVAGMSGKARMPGQRSGLLRVHLGLGQRLDERPAPAVEVYGASVLRLLEELPLPRGHRTGGPVRKFSGLPAVDHGPHGAIWIALLSRDRHLEPEGAPQVATEGRSVTNLRLRLSGALAATGREDEPLRRPASALPPICEDGAQDGGNGQFLRTSCLAARCPPVPEAALRVERLPPECVQIPRPESPEAPGH